MEHAIPSESRILVGAPAEQASFPFAPRPVDLRTRLLAGEAVQVGPSVVQVFEVEPSFGRPAWTVEVTFEERTFDAVPRGSTTAPRSREAAVDLALRIPNTQAWFISAAALGPVTREELPGEWREFPDDGEGSSTIRLTYHEAIPNRAFEGLVDGFWLEVRRDVVHGQKAVSFWAEGQCSRPDWTRQQFNIGRRRGSYEEALAVGLRWLRVARAFVEAPCCGACGDLVPAGVPVCETCRGSGEEG